MQHDITPQQAREQLAEAEAATNRRADDRRVHALATAGFGLLIGAYVALYRLAEGSGWQVVVLSSYVLMLVALSLWQTRSSRSWPRHARRVSWTGFTATMVLFLAVVMTLNYREAQQELDGSTPSEDVLLLLLAGGVVAVPMLVAALVIARRGQK